MVTTTRITNDVITLSKYATGVAINKVGEASNILPSVGVFSAVQGGMWLFRNRKNISRGLKSAAIDMRNNKKIMDSVAKPGKGILNRIKNLWRGGGEIVSKNKLTEMAASKGKNAAQAAKALANGKNFTQSLKAIQGKGIGKALLRGIKGNALFAGITLATSTFTDIVPAFQLGKEQGFRQIGKTLIKTGAEVGGWAAGAAAGAKIGAIVGTCIGGPVGTAVGSIIGLAGGFIGSYICSQVAEKVVGPNEVELAQEENAQSVAQEAISNGSEGMSQVAQAAYNQLLQNAAQNGGVLSEDDKAAKKSLERLIGQKINIREELAQAQASGLLTQNTEQQAQQPIPQGQQAEPTIAVQQPQTQVASQTQDVVQTQQQTPEQIAQQQILTDLPTTSEAMYTPFSPMQTSMPGVNPFLNPSSFYSTNPFDENSQYKYQNYV